MRRRNILAVALALLVGACSPKAAPVPSTQAAAPPVAATSAAPEVAAEAPPTVNGMYIEKNACPGEGCYFRRAQALKAIDLYDKPGRSPMIVAQVAPGEWVDRIASEDRFAPVKGIVRADHDPFKSGDIVYRLGNQGEGCFDVWEKGASGMWCDTGSDDPVENGGIEWDKASPATDGSEGWWVQVTRENGPGGWLRNPRDFRCLGLQDRDADCPPVN